MASRRAQWLRAAILGANDGVNSTASLMMGFGAFKADVKGMILTGLAALVIGACSMAIGERAQLHRDRELRGGSGGSGSKEEELPSPLLAAAVSALSFFGGAIVPLLAAAFVRPYRVRLVAVVAAVTVALVALGWLGAALGRAPVARSTIRVLFGGWLAVGVTFGLTKLIGSNV